ncbi:hypothetical protein [Campylobacter hyointestinalis]|uniref:Clan AA aspartic protease n=2 Tax=Campylobacter hyointestinalis TaxID=198 RepID=A0AAV6ECQ3_CAMHY|nr:hypothetical protein [Campylobacter hyointestinalis]KAB0612058.1 hypothetical protein F7P66_06870 [Campylobacter hyointestinalis subsp. lawsonii]QKF69317.1 hypothetical protein CHLWT_0740 [Campylobacter hyointestinalis subsp. lawsonii]RAZ28232.1 hypothetical protein CHLT_04935 [Campylobacter hyointestinalis subsp. lawsonii]RAZ49275.1 hypothetical protein CHL9004_07665 [Campylobacter hyointestinalis subsp. lawsonii]RAZ51072.1 hypothetical protein CHL10075_08745 [Campylobacter hyointestinalis
MASWIRKFLPSLYISVLAENKECQIYGQVIKNGKVIKTVEAVFDCNNHKVDPKFNTYLKTQENLAHWTYVGTLLNNSKHWALPVSSKDGYTKFNINYSSVNIVTMAGGWSIFVYKNEIEKMQTFFNDMQPNLIYSPFALLYEKIKNNLEKNQNILYVYSLKESSALMIFDDTKMQFSAFFQACKTADDLIDEKELKAEDTTDIENIISKEEDKFNDLGSLEDLDNVVKNSQKDDFEDIQEVNTRDLEESVRDIGKETFLLNNIRSAINEYYKNELYDSNFIDKIIIYDNNKLDKSFIDVLGSELMINSYINEVDTIKDMNELMIRELNI